MARDKALIVGNWKMNLGVHEASLYLHKLNKIVKIHRNVEVVVAPTMLALLERTAGSGRSVVSLFSETTSSG